VVLVFKYKCRSDLCKSMATGWHSSTAEINSQLTKQTTDSNAMIFQSGSKYKLIRSLFSYISFPSRHFRAFKQVLKEAVTVSPIRSVRGSVRPSLCMKHRFFLDIFVNSVSGMITNIFQC